MRNLLLVKYAPEIFLKGLNRGKFERKLKKNIEKVLYGEDYEFVFDMGRCFIYSNNLEDIIAKVKNVFGVSEVCIVEEMDLNLDTLKERCIEFVRLCNVKNFKVETNRANKSFPKNSMEISRDLGAWILESIEGISVKIKDPELTVFVEIREKAYLYTKRVKGIGGLPYGMNGSTMLMLSGGIDSPVAGYLMARRGVELNCVYYHSHPYTSERAQDKVIELYKVLGGYTGKIKLYIVSFTEIQLEIMDKCREDELTIIMRRFMMRIACELSKKYNINSVTTGESIGQVASQTMESLVVTDNVSDRPVFRPLISMDKEEIINISKNIGTFDISILPYEDCCTIFVPKHPKTKPRLENIISSEEKLDIEGLVSNSLNNIKIITEV